MAIRHGRSAGGSDHAHLVVTLVAEDGSKASVHNDRPRAQKACRELEQRFGLRRLEARTREAGQPRAASTASWRPTGAAAAQLGERGEHAERSSRQTLERIVRACATASRDESEFIRRLRDARRAAAAPATPRAAPSKVVGYSVRLPGARPRAAAERVVRRRPPRARPDASRRCGAAGAKTPRRSDGRSREWSSSTPAAPRSPAERQAELEQRGLMWHRCTTELERVRQQLRAAGTDPAAIAHAAREGAGVLAAWSIALEGEQPGALARAARQLARSAELPAHTPVPPKHALARVRAGAVHARRWQARQRRRLADRLRARSRCSPASSAACTAPAASSTAPRQIETELGAELAQIEATLERERPRRSEVLDAEAQAAKRAREPKLAIQKGEELEIQVAHRLYVRMSLHERLQHAVLVLSFVALVVTGFMLRYPEAWWVVGIRQLSNRAFDLRGLAHRVAGVVMLAGGAWHIGYLAFTRPGRKLFMDLLPRWNDLTDPWKVLKYNLGLAPDKPAFGRFCYIEKAEYWALVWGTLLMGATGAILWFENASMNWFTKLGFDAARTVHFYEAVLATLAIIVWHLYFVIFNPDVYPMNLAWLTGRMSEKEMMEEHPLQLEEMKAEERAAEDAPDADDPSVPPAGPAEPMDPDSPPDDRPTREALRIEGPRRLAPPSSSTAPGAAGQGR